VFEYSDVAEIAEENIYLRGLLNEVTGNVKQPIEGLTIMMSRIVFMMRNANGRYLARENILEILHHDLPGDSPVANVIPVHITRIKQRRPDLGECIQNKRGGLWRWMKHNESSQVTYELENRG